MSKLKHIPYQPSPNISSQALSRRIDIEVSDWIRCDTVFCFVLFSIHIVYFFIVFTQTFALLHKMFNRGTL